MPEVVKNEINPEGNSYRTVRIDGVYGTHTLVELYAFFYSNGMKLTSLSNDKKPRSFTINGDEMDSLAATWIKFREDCISAKEAEEKRVAEVMAEAFKVIQECPAITVRSDKDYNNNDFWNITVDETSFFDEYAQTPDQLLSTVKEALESYTAHIARIEEAKQIAKDHTEIQILASEDTDDKHWKVSIPSLDWKYPFDIYSSSDLLKQAKEALRALTTHQQLSSLDL